MMSANSTGLTISPVDAVARGAIAEGGLIVRTLELLGRLLPGVPHAKGPPAAWTRGCSWVPARYLILRFTPIEWG
jgi:hypothetical protein